jgi:hypothetical protein
VNWRRLWLFLWGPTLDDLIPIVGPSGEPPSDRNELAGAAKRLLEDPVFALALDRIQKRLYDTWRQSEVGDEQARERQYHLHWAVEEVKSELRRMVDSVRTQSPEQQ